MSWSDDEFDIDGFDEPNFDEPNFDDEEEDLATTTPKVEKPPAPPKPEVTKKAKGKKLRQLKEEQKRQKQAKIDEEMRKQRQREREIKLKLGANASSRDIQTELAKDAARRDVQDLFGNSMALPDDDDHVDPETAAFLSAEKSQKGAVTLSEEAAQFNTPTEHALAVLKIIGVTEYEEFGSKLGEKLVDENNVENAMALISALAKSIKPLLGSKEFGEISKVTNVLKNDKMQEERLARGKKKKKNTKPKVQTIRESDLAGLGGGDYGGTDTYYDQYW